MITFYSLFTTILWANIMCVLIIICRRNMLFIRYVGITSILIMFVCCLLRVVIPVELSLTKVIVLPNLLNPVYNFLNSTLYVNSNTSVLDIILLIWVVVSVILLLRFIILYAVHLRQISMLPSITTPQIDRILKGMIYDKDKNKVKVTLYPIISVPMICGFQKGTILLPVVEYSDRELMLIISHEYAHFKNYDSYISLLVEIFCICFWWNPFVYIVKHDIHSLLEINCDIRMMKDKQAEDVLFYADTLIKFLKGNVENKNPFFTSVNVN